MPPDSRCGRAWQPSARAPVLMHRRAVRIRAGADSSLHHQDTKGPRRVSSMSSEVAHAPPVLSLTDGGPGAALLKRLRLTYSELGAASPRTAIILVAVTWPPLCLLAVLQGLATGGTQLPFLHDIASHVRFLFAVPALALAEIPVGARLRRTA